MDQPAGERNSIGSNPYWIETPFCQKLISREVARICMQLHATAYTQNFPPKTCAMFRGPQTCAELMKAKMKFGYCAFGISSGIRHFAIPQLSTTKPQLTVIPRSDWINLNWIKTPFCQKIFPRASARTCAHRRAPTRSLSRSQKNMCEVSWSAQACAAGQMTC